MTERFGLEFAGKAAARRAAHVSPSGALVPDVEASVGFDDARHVFVEGDNLEVLRLLRRAYHGRVQAMYLDPPYNTGRDFVYRDRFGESAGRHLRRTGQVDERGTPLVSNPSTSGRYHSAWLAMMLPRLVLARQLLRDDGLLFVSIDDHEVHHLRMLLDEIFGEDCFVAQIVVVGNRGGRDYLRIAVGHEYVLVYGATPDAPVRELPKAGPAPRHTDDRGLYELRDLRNRNPKFHPGNRPNLFYPIFVAPDRVDAEGLCAVGLDENAAFPVAVQPRNKEGQGSVWRWGKDRLRAAIVDGDPVASEVVARRKRDGSFGVFEKHRKRTTKPRALWDDTAVRSETGTIALRQRLGAALFDHPKPVELVRRCLQLGTDPDAIVMDLFAGAATTAEAVLQLNRQDGGDRRFVLVQLGEVLPDDAEARDHGYRTVADVARARIRAVLDPDDGVRCFRVAPRVNVAWDGASTLDPRAYLAALREHEQSRLQVPVHPWQIALDRGITLDASTRAVDRQALLFADPARERALAVAWGEALTPDEVAAWDLPAHAELACRDDALDDAAAFVLARRVRLHRL